jgi:hydroxyacylglutathione hydrolase
VKIATFAVGEFQENSYLLLDEDAGRCVFIDPGAEPGRLIRAVRDSGAALEAIWVTHAHLDHLGGIAGLLDEWPVPVHLHPLDRPLYDAADRQAAAYGIHIEPPPPPDRSLAEGDTLRLGDLSFAVMHAPGHSPGHVVLHGHGVAFTGDCLFFGSIGRTDLPLSEPAALVRSLGRISKLPADTVIYPGHGPSSTIGRERMANPFLNGSANVLGG